MCIFACYYFNAQCFAIICHDEKHWKCLIDKFDYLCKAIIFALNSWQCCLINVNEIMGELMKILHTSILIVVLCLLFHMESIRSTENEWYELYQNLCKSSTKLWLAEICSQIFTKLEQSLCLKVRENGSNYKIQSFQLFDSFNKKCFYYLNKKLHSNLRKTIIPQWTI